MKATREFPVRWIGVGIVVLLNVLVYEASHDPMIRLRVVDWKRNRKMMAIEQQMIRLSESDLGPGSRMPSFKRLRACVGLRKGPVAVLMLGDCSACSLKYLKELEQWARLSKVGLVAVADADLQRLKDEWKEMGLTVPFLVDPKGELHVACNAFFTPRAYLVDQDGRVVWVQPRGVPLTHLATQLLPSGQDKPQ